MKAILRIVSVSGMVVMMAGGMASASWFGDLANSFLGSGMSAATSISAEDMQNLTGNETDIIKTMAAGMMFAAKADEELRVAVGQSANDDIEAINLLKSDKSKSGLEQAARLLKQSKPLESKDYDSFANGTEEQKKTLKSAMERASQYRHVSDICLAAAAVQGVSVIKDARALLMSRDLSRISELNHIISTGKMANRLLKQTRKGFAAYDKKANKAKQILNPEEAASDSEKVKEMAKQAKDGGFPF